VLRNFWILALAPSLLSGCSDGPQTIPVTGNIRFAGGPPPANGTITFMPVEAKAGMPRRPGTGKFDPEDSTYEVTTFKPGDGLIPGRYAVNISCYTSPPSSAKPESFVVNNAVPEDWQPEEVAVEEDSDDLELDFDVPSKKK